MFFKVVDFFVGSWSFFSSDLTLLMLSNTLRDPGYNPDYYILKG
jgi:hypothetical protein